MAKADPPPEFRKGFCGHCFTESRQKLEHVVHHEIEDTAGRTFDATYVMAVCLTCERPLIYHVIDATVEGSRNWFQEADLVWPDESKLHESVPTEVRECYSEAYPIVHLAPNAFAGQIRRAFEFICKDKGAPGKNLAQQVKWLGEQGMIPGSLAKMTASLRLLGNAGVHATDKKVTREDAWAIDGFFRSIVEYVYVAPAKLHEYEERLKRPPAVSVDGYTFKS